VNNANAATLGLPPDAASLADQARRLLSELTAAGTPIDHGQRAADGDSPVARVGTPDGIARTEFFCVSDLSMFLTGPTLLGDGGSTI
jgi:NAD(P)-dependent dehydrogenase (short-subunit alcohol dehydrogenase family)